MLYTVMLATTTVLCNVSHLQLFAALAAVRCEVQLEEVASLAICSSSH
jgi:hypothetical protein